MGKIYKKKLKTCGYPSDGCTRQDKRTLRKAKICRKRNLCEKENTLLLANTVKRDILIYYGKPFGWHYILSDETFSLLLYLPKNCVSVYRCGKRETYFRRKLNKLKFCIRVMFKPF